MKIQIKNRFIDDVIVEHEADENSTKITVELAVKNKIDLRGADLRNADLRNANLRGASLRGADLRNANLRSADLSIADLSNANLRSADLSNANLRGASLRGADLSIADLRSADLSIADLSNANLRGADLSNANLRDAVGIERIYRDGLSILKHQDCMLKAYKYLNGEHSPYQHTRYEVGKTYECDDFNAYEKELCGKGLNVATIEWCLRDASCDLSKTYIEVEFHSKDIVAVPYFTDGKFRVKKFTVLRKLEEAELKSYMEPM